MNGKKAAFPGKARTRSHQLGWRIHSDLKALPVRSKAGAKYAICFVDDASRRGKSYPMKTKDQAMEMFMKFLAEEVSAKGRRCARLRSDNGGEYIGDEFKAWCNSHGIEQEFSPPHCQSGNGVSECYWRETFKFVRTVLWDQQCEDTYWAVALHFADVIRNHLLTSSVEGGVPEAVWQDKQVDVSHFRVPLSKCYSFIEKDNRDGTLSRRRMPGIFIGYARQSPCYLIYDTTTNTVYNRRYADVAFDETSKAPTGAAPSVAWVDTLLAQLDLNLPLANSAMATIPPSEQSKTPGFLRTRKIRTVSEIAKVLGQTPEDYLVLLKQYDGWYQELTSIDSKIDAGSDVPMPGYWAKEDAKIAPPPTCIASRTHRKKKSKTHKQLPGGQVEISHSKGVRRSARAADIAAATREVHAHLAVLSKIQARVAIEARREQASKEHAHECAVTLGGAHTPTSAPKHYKAARTGDHSDQWAEAEVAEWMGLWRMQAFEDHPITQGMKLHHMLWTYKVKSNGILKARLCFDGRHQDPATYDTNIHSPTMRLTSFRILLATAAQKGWSIFGDDATQAFLNADRPADRPLYASYPEGFKKPGRCVLVKKMQYGLHDAPMGWFLAVRQHLLEDQHFKQSKTDECLFYKKDIVVVVHVDDFCSTGTDTALQEYRRKLYERFTMTGGPIDEYYGLEVVVDKNKGQVSVKCKGYLERLVTKLKLTPRTVKTPAVADEILPKLEGECKNKVLQKRYRQLVGSIMHPAVTCRPDVAAAVRNLSAHLQHPGGQHLIAAERVVHYLWSTREEALTYTRRDTSGNTLTPAFFGTCDASHNVTHDSKGITGWAYQLCNGAVAWKCRAQDIVALSSCEAELIAVDEAVRELRFLHKLLEDFGTTVSEPTLIGQDNMSTIALTKGSHFNARTKHVSLRYHHVGEQQRAGNVTLQYLTTDAMPADLLTKPLAYAQHWRHTKVLLGHVPLLWKSKK
jgi:hypothetical protein